MWMAASESTTRRCQAKLMSWKFLKPPSMRHNFHGWAFYKVTWFSYSLKCVWMSSCESSQVFLLLINAFVVCYFSLWRYIIENSLHSVKSVLIRSFSGLIFRPFGLNTEIYRVNIRIQSKGRKIRTRISALFTQCYCFAESFKNFIRYQILGKIDYVEYWLIAASWLEVFLRRWIKFMGF